MRFQNDISKIAYIIHINLRCRCCCCCECKCANILAEFCSLHAILIIMAVARTHTHTHAFAHVAIENGILPYIRICSANAKDIVVRLSSTILYMCSTLFTDGRMARGIYIYILSCYRLRTLQPELIYCK